MDNEFAKPPEPTEEVKTKQFGKTWEDYWPGKIGLQTQGNMSGAKFAVFLGNDWVSCAIKLNSWFAENPGHLTWPAVPLPPDSNGSIGLGCYYSKQVDPAQMEKFNRYHTKALELVEAEDAAEAEAKAKLETMHAKSLKDAEEKQKMAMKELNALAEEGRVHRNHCKKEKKDGKKK
jgi:hypothetical protein